MDEQRRATRRPIDVPAGDRRVPANVVVPDEAPAAVVVAGGPRQDALLGRVARDLQEARLATLLLHVETPPGRPEDPEAPTPERSAWEQARIAGAVRWLQGDGATADLPIGLFALGGAADGGLRAAADPALPVRALVAYNGRFVRDGGGSPSAPALLLVDAEAPVEVAAENEATRQALEERPELQGLPAAYRSDEERLQEAVAIAVRWFDRHL
jgi:putative phosphoribosyl transferase